jgi:pyridinium-3,5-biscarboxylic acid mononucleotide synthase
MKKKQASPAPSGFAQVDLERQVRCGNAEVIFGSGKTPEQIHQIALTLKKAGQSVLITRTDRKAYLRLKHSFPGLRYDPLARILSWQNPQHKTQNRKLHILVCAAGTSDLPVAEEAALTSEFFGNQVERIYDVGVAGLHRLISQLERLRSCDAIIAVAGMEGALPSVITGLVSCPVFAVPTSIGYGANLQGITTLLSMLSSCSSGLSVVNIDNGFGAAMAAERMKFLLLKKKS